jgi:hypothetical protein
MHYTHVERWRRAAEQYHAHTGASYFDDLFGLHAALDLAIACAAETRAFAHLTPARNREIVFLADAAQKKAEGVKGRRGDMLTPSPQHPFSSSEGFAEALCHVLRRLIDYHGMRAFNVAIALPPLGPTSEDWRAMPIIARIADRGDPMTTRGDLGAMELFAANVITADPFEVATLLQTRDMRHET